MLRAAANRARCAAPEILALRETEGAPHRMRRGGGRQLGRYVVRLGRIVLARSIGVDRAPARKLVDN